MKRRAMTALLGAVSLTATLVMAAPAHAGETMKWCGSDSGVVGITQGDIQMTALAGMSWSHCGTLGVKVNYVHVGGDSWTPWKYSKYGAGSVRKTTKNAVRSLHSTSVNSLRFYSYK